ncbi:MAG: bifunctional folylpolyglutamate synthase/dihydrofolate synthase [Candidatus Dadabacteria bacterium]|nr:MAG: bifunctional folylpolyglutamate synthase/dihydrofolate synthase [Candidatus Dadabacteria bacterium]
MNHAAFWRRLERRKPEAAMALGLVRVEHALNASGRPDVRYPSIIVAGTNGKGSTCRFVAEALRLSGYRAGLFASPHVYAPNERIVIDGVAVSEDDLVATLSRLEQRMSELTWFELFYLAAAEMFAEASVDIAVFEVGLGGRLDATNATANVIATAITTIGLDHTHILGDSLEAIAAEKAGIMRPGIPVVTGVLPAAAAAVVERRAIELGAPWVVVEDEADVPELPRWLRRNLALARRIALEVAPDIDVPDIRLASQRPPGRWQVLARRPWRIIDGGHNPDGVRAAVAAWQEICDCTGTLYLAVPATKNLAGIAAALDDWRGDLVAVERGDGWWSAAELRQCCGLPSRLATLQDARDEFLTGRDHALWLGSLRGLDVFAEAVRR